MAGTLVKAAGLSELPEPDAYGDHPAVEYPYVSLVRKIIFNNSGQLMPEKPEERFCREAFTRHLKTTQFSQPSQWVHEPKGNATPPDYYMQCGSLIYSVEITSLMSQYEQTNQKSLSSEGIWSITEKHVQNLKCEMSMVLHDHYILSLSSPCNSFECSIKEIMKKLKDFISRTAEMKSVENTSGIECGQSYSIRKLGSEMKLGNEMGEVGISIAGGNEGWSNDIMAELVSLVRSAISSKSKKLQNVEKPWILLLLDRYHLALESEYATVQNELADPDNESSVLHNFYAVYFINWKKDVFRLYPLEDRSNQRDPAFSK